LALNGYLRQTFTMAAQGRKPRLRAQSFDCILPT
jgi:hypothetical protein